MRRHDREITEKEEMIEILNKCSVCRLAFNDIDYPYIVPLNYGVEVTAEEVVLYFHSAKTGTKHDLIKRDNRVSFEVDCGHTLVLEQRQLHNEL